MVGDKLPHHVALNVLVVIEIRFVFFEKTVFLFFNCQLGFVDRKVERSGEVSIFPWLPLLYIKIVLAVLRH